MNEYLPQIRRLKLTIKEDCLLRALVQHYVSLNVELAHSLRPHIVLEYALLSSIHESRFHVLVDKERLVAEKRSII